MQALLVAGRQFDLDFVRDGPSHFRLHLEHIIHASLVTLSPQMRFIAYTDELCRDAYPLPGAAHGTSQDMGHSELAADLRDVFRSRLELHGRGSRYYAETLRAQASQIGDHLLGQPLAEV